MPKTKNYRIHQRTFTRIHKKQKKTERKKKTGQTIYINNIYTKCNTFGKTNSIENMITSKTNTKSWCKIIELKTNKNKTNHFPYLTVVHQRFDSYVDL